MGFSVFQSIFHNSNFLIKFPSLRENFTPVTIAKPNWVMIRKMLKVL